MPKKKKKPYEYPPETINAAWELFKLNKTFKEIAKAIKIPRLQTIQDWAKKFNWYQRRENIEKQARKKADEKAINELAKSKAEYRKENLTVTDKIKYISNEYLNQCMNEIELAKREDAYAESFNQSLQEKTPALLKKTDNLKILLNDPKFQEKFKLGAKETRDTVKCQDAMLFGTNHQDDSKDLDYGKAIATVYGVSENSEGVGE